MKKIGILFAILFIISCTQNPSSHSHENPQDNAHNHGGIKIYITEYSDNYELFAESDPFVKGQSSELRLHLSSLHNFKPQKDAEVSLSLLLGGNASELINGIKKQEGVFDFKITPLFSGKGKLKFIIKTKGEEEIVESQKETVYRSEDEAFHSEDAKMSNMPTIAFTKEQSWKIDFKTEQAKTQPFGKVIRSVGQIRTTQGDALMVSSRSNGILTPIYRNLIDGKRIKKGEALYSISSSGFADKDLMVRISEAENDLVLAKANFGRIDKLFTDKMVTQQVFLEAQRSLDNTTLKVKNLEDALNKGGKVIRSPATGFVHNILVQNGEYVEPGQNILTLIRNEKLIIQADVNLSNASILKDINSVSLKSMHDNRSIEFTDLNTSNLTIGKHTNEDNFMVPLTLELNKSEEFLPGTFVELYFKTLTNQQALTIPNASIMEEQGKYYVFIQQTPEAFEKKYIEKGQSDGIRTEIVNGLSAKERVVSNGALFVKLAQISGAIDAHAGHVH